MGDASCGSGGCNTLILAREGASWKVIQSITITRPPIRVLASTSHGWHSISVWVQGGGIQPGYEAEPRFGGRTYPAGVSWPPPIRISLTAGEQDVKLAAMKAHASQWVIDHDYLGRFAKSEEIFWPARSHP